MRRIGVVFGQRTEYGGTTPFQSAQWKKTVWNIPREVYRRQLRWSPSYWIWAIYSILPAS